MNEEEMACCKQMAGDCGAMNNSAHSCCKKVSQAGDVLAFSSVNIHSSLDHQFQSHAPFKSDAWLSLTPSSP
jgi:hypothetical protein